MSMRTKKSAFDATSSTRRMLSTDVARSISSPSCVSFTEMFRLMPAFAIDSTMAMYSRVDRVASSRVVTRSPR